MFMDEVNDKPPEATVKQKLFTEESNIDLVPITLERISYDLPKIKSRTTLKYISGTEQSDSICSSSPSFIQTSPTASSSSLETRRPNNNLGTSSSPSFTTTGCSTHAVLSGPIVPSPPTSKSSTTPPFVSSRSTTPVRDTIIESQNSSRRRFDAQEKGGLRSSMRSLSSSFQSECFVHASKKFVPVRSTAIDHISKTSALPIYDRKRTPLIGRNTSEQSKSSSFVQDAHSRVVEQHRWPAMKGGKVSTMTFSRSVDLTDRIGKAASFMLQSRGFSPIRRGPQSDGISKSIHKSSSEVFQYTSTNVEHGTKSDINMSLAYIQRGKDMPSTNPSRTLSLPIALRCPSSSNSASVLSLCDTKRTTSPSNTRPSSPSFSCNNTSQIGTPPPAYSHILDMKKGIKGADMENFHQFRLLYNRELHWRFINCKTEAALATQKVAAENIFNNVWNVTSELQDYVSREKHKIETLKQEIKLDMLLNEQVSYLEEWIALEGEYSTALFRIVEALRASTLRLPVILGARVDVRAVKNAVSSAIDIMQSMGSSICYLLSKVEGTRSLICELSTVVRKEKEMLHEYRVLLATVTAMKVEECSLRAQILQQF